jgi:predicted nucleotidyltransferase
MLTETQKNIIIETLKPYNPTRIGIFGSVARGEATDESDIDILYRFDNKVGLFTLMDIIEKLETKLKKKVDLVSEKYVNPLLKAEIQKDLTLIYEQN